MTSLENILKSINNVKVITESIAHKKYYPLDLSESNQELSKISIEDASDFENYIEKFLNKNNAEVAYGGYTEKRNLYKRSTAFKNNETEERNIHIGLDLWIKAETSVLSALDGTIHSFKNNNEIGNYGPTIILKHQIKNQTFYTLYGHLSLDSIENLKIGMSFKKGQQLATLGDASINGDYSPHLHFQIIEDIGDYFGDYPGVCSETDLNFYLNNCPDPNLLLKITP